jgi:hypothetical protein
LRYSVLSGSSERRSWAPLEARPRCPAHDCNAEDDGEPVCNATALRSDDRARSREQRGTIPDPGGITRGRRASPECVDPWRSRDRE